LYGRPCRSPVSWNEVGEEILIGPEMVQQAHHVISVARDRLRAAQSCQKSYMDKRMRPLEFEVGDYVMLKVSPMKGVKQFGAKGKLAPRFVGPFKVLERIGFMAYRLELPEQLKGVHDVFHVSMLRKFFYDEEQDLIVDFRGLQIEDDATVSFPPVKIVDVQEKGTRRNRIRTVKVQWSDNPKNVTWEIKDVMQKQHPHLFVPFEENLEDVIP
jgi:hypothetical protein